MKYTILKRSFNNVTRSILFICFDTARKNICDKIINRSWNYRRYQR